MESTQDQSPTALPGDGLVPLESIVCTEELNGRGLWKPHVGGRTSRDFGPCGDVLDRKVPL